jgi:hypothetical protein
LIGLHNPVKERAPTHILDGFADRQLRDVMAEGTELSLYGIWSNKVDSCAAGVEMRLRLASVKPNSAAMRIRNSAGSRYRATGALEMNWHLFTWGDEVKVLEPKDCGIC